MKNIDKMLGAVGALFLVACGNADVTDLNGNPAGFGELSTLEAPLLRDFHTGETPATTNYDFTTVSQLTGTNYWVALDAWVEVDDPSAGVLNFAMTYLDSVGNSRTVAFGGNGNLILSNPASVAGGAVRSIQRLSDTSAWDLDVTLVSGVAGTAEVGWLVTVTPDNPSDVSDFAYVP